MTTLLDAFELGVATGVLSGVDACPEDWPEELRAAYKRGYDHGVWLYCELREREAAHD